MQSVSWVDPGLHNEPGLPKGIRRWVHNRFLEVGRRNVVEVGRWNAEVGIYRILTFFSSECCIFGRGILSRRSLAKTEVPPYRTTASPTSKFVSPDTRCLTPYARPTPAPDTQVFNPSVLSIQLYAHTPQRATRTIQHPVTSIQHPGSSIEHPKPNIYSPVPITQYLFPSTRNPTPTTR